MIAVAEGSLIRETPERVGAALTKPGRVSTAEWCGSGKRGTKVDVRNQWSKPLELMRRLELGGYGPVSGAHPLPLWVVGNSPVGVA